MMLITAAKDCGATSWPEAIALVALFFALAAAFIVYRLTGGD